MSKARELIKVLDNFIEVENSKIKIISRKEAEKIGKRQVKDQNALQKSYPDKLKSYKKFVIVYAGGTPWNIGKKTKYYKENQRLLVWRVDGAEWASDREGKEWVNKGIELVNDKNEYWFVLADYE